MPVDPWTAPSECDQPEMTWFILEPEHQFWKQPANVWLTVLKAALTRSRRSSSVTFPSSVKHRMSETTQARFLSHDDADMLIAFEASYCLPIYIGDQRAVRTPFSQWPLIRSQVRHRPIVFDSRALLNRQLTTKQWCTAPYGKNRQQYIDGLLKNWCQHQVKWTRLLWEAMMIWRTSSAEKHFETQ